MIATTYIVFFILCLLAITYPEEFPKMVRNPDLLLDAIGLETKRRWLILKFGTLLFFERKRLQYSLWKAQGIIKAERLKHKQQDESND